MAIVGLIAGTTAPFIRAYMQSETVTKVRNELRILGQTLDKYWMENTAFPATLTESETALIALLPPSGSIDTSDLLLDDFNLALSDSTYYQYSTAGTPTVATIFSLGLNNADEGGGGDDITIEVTSERAGRIMTRRKIQTIAHATMNYIVSKNYATYATDAWALTSIDSTSVQTSLQLGTGGSLGANLNGIDFSVDGWGNAWIIHNTRYRIYSKGPDGTDNSGGAASADGTAIAGDDIGF